MSEHRLAYDKIRQQLKDLTPSQSNSRLDPVLQIAIKREVSKTTVRSPNEVKDRARRMLFDNVGNKKSMKSLLAAESARSVSPKSKIAHSPIMVSDPVTMDEGPTLKTDESAQ